MIGLGFVCTNIVLAELLLLLLDVLCFCCNNKGHVFRATPFTFSYPVSRGEPWRLHMMCYFAVSSSGRYCRLFSFSFYGCSCLRQLPPSFFEAAVGLLWHLM